MPVKLVKTIYAHFMLNQSIAYTFIDFVLAVQSLQFLHISSEGNQKVLKGRSE